MCPSTATMPPPVPLDEKPMMENFLRRPVERFLVLSFRLDSNGPDKTQQLASYGRDHYTLVFTTDHHFPVPRM